MRILLNILTVNLLISCSLFQEGSRYPDEKTFDANSIDTFQFNEGGVFTISDTVVNGDTLTKTSKWR